MVLFSARFLLPQQSPTACPQNILHQFAQAAARIASLKKGVYPALSFSMDNAAKTVLHKLMLTP